MVPQPKINYIPFFVGPEQLFAHYIEPLNGIEHKRFPERFHIIVHRVRGHFSSAGYKVVRNALYRYGAAHAARKKTGDGFEQRNVRNLALCVVGFPSGLAVLNIAHDNGIIYSFKVCIRLVRRFIHCGYIRHSAVAHVFIERRFARAARRAAIFAKGQRQHGKLNIAPGKQRCKVSRKHIRIGTG